MNSKRKICVITTGRSDYGLLYPLLRYLKEDPDVHLQLVATGSHLSERHGYTITQIEADGFRVDAAIATTPPTDNEVGILEAIARGFEEFPKVLEALRPDVVVVLGDRYELFNAVISSLVLKIPVAHIHGGEITEGAFDDAIRHAVTKMAHYHFVATETYRKRVIQLGEFPDNVFCVGAPGLDTVQDDSLYSRDEIETWLNRPFKSLTFLVTYHPVTLEKEGPAKDFQAILNVLDDYPEALIIFTEPNADPYGGVISDMIQGYVEKREDRAVSFKCLGQKKYLSLLKQVQLVIGNSSSGIIEAPSFKIPTINISDRQKGRVRAESVIDCPGEEEAIESAIKFAFSPSFQKSLQKCVNPYKGDEDASKLIYEKLKEIPLGACLKKKFYDMALPLMAEAF